METKPTGGRKALGRRDFLRGIGAGAVGGTAVLVAAPLAATPARADSETANDRTKARYQANSPDIQTYYRVNGYPAKKK